MTTDGFVTLGPEINFLCLTLMLQLHGAVELSSPTIPLQQCLAVPGCLVPAVCPAHPMSSRTEDTMHISARTPLFKTQGNVGARAAGAEPSLPLPCSTAQGWARLQPYPRAGDTCCPVGSERAARPCPQQQGTCASPAT